MISVLFFAKVREATGKTELEMEYNANVKDIGSLYKNISDHYHELKNLKNVKCALNQELVSDWSLAIMDGDEVAFFPPITGG